MFKLDLRHFKRSSNSKVGRFGAMANGAKANGAKANGAIVFFT